MEVGLDPGQFWRLTLREINFIFRGAVAGNRHHQNQMLSAAWHAAKMTAYAPEKPRDFVKLEKLLLSDTQKTRARADWRTVLAKMQGWANPKGRK